MIVMIYAANGDLNRDQTKLMVVLKQAFSDFGPHVALDLHLKRFYSFGRAWGNKLL